MAKRRREPDSDGTAAEMEEFSTVFVDTSLDTHLAMLVSTCDTVSDFKKKMALEHKQCFPSIGEIQIHSVKVKHRSNFYHLPDIMLVWSAFHGVKGNWFLSADASGAHKCLSIKNSCEFDTNNGVKMGVTNVNDNCRGLSSDVNRMQILSIPLPDGATEKNVVSEMVAGFRFEKSVEKTTDFQSNICSEENQMGTDSRPKKKRKMRNMGDACHNPSLEDACTLFQASGKDTSRTEIVGCRNKMVDAMRESPGGGILHEQNGKSLSDATAEVSVGRNNQFDAENRLVFEGTSPPTTAEKSNLGSIMSSQNLLASDERREDNALESKMEYELAQDAPTKHSEGVSIKVPDHSATLMDDGGGVGEDNTDGSRRKKKKVQKTDRKIQDTTDMEQTWKGESMKPSSETHKSEKREEKGLSLEHDHEVIMPSNSKASDHVDRDLTLKELCYSRDADAVMEPEISSGIKKKKKKKKKREKKSVDTNLDKLGIEQTDNGSEGKEEEKGLSLEHDHGVIMPSNSKVSDHVNPDLMPKDSSFSCDADTVMEPEISSGIKKKKKKKKKREKKSVDTNLDKLGIEQTDNDISGSSDLFLPSTDHIPEDTGKEGGITHYEGKDVQMLLDSSTLDAKEKVQGVNRNEADFVVLTQDVGSGKEKTQSSVGNCDADIPSVETENPIMDFNQVDKVNENSENMDRKTSKKRKKRKLTASEVQENLPIEDQQVGIEALATKETSISFVNSGQEGRHVDSSQVLSSKPEEKLNETHGIPENTDDLAKTLEKEGEGINFKQYFVPDQHQDKVDSGHKVKKATKSNQEAKTSKKVKDNDLPAVSNSTELEDSLKSIESKKAENKSCRKGSSRSKGETAQNSDRDEMISNSFRRSSGASEKGAKDSTPSELCETTLQKPDEVLAASSRLNKKNRSLDKSSSERSEIFPGKQGNKRSQSGGLNVTKMMPMKTPQKKSLFTKSGAIFQDNSGESSGDENGSDGSAISPSDSSSTSVGESDLSQDSTRNGTSDAEGRSTGRRNMPKLDLSASKDMTMDMILKSSKRYKKAKLVASQNEDEQNESQAIEFVPDSQPS